MLSSQNTDHDPDGDPFYFDTNVKQWDYKRHTIVAPEQGTESDASSLDLETDAPVAKPGEQGNVPEPARILLTAAQRRAFRCWVAWSTYLAKVRITVDSQFNAARGVILLRVFRLWKQVASLPLRPYEQPDDNEAHSAGGVAAPRHDAEFVPQSVSGPPVQHPPLVSTRWLYPIAKVGTETKRSLAKSILSVRATIILYPIFVGWKTYIHIVVSFEEQLAKAGVEGNAYKFQFREMYSGRRWRREVMQTWRPKNLCRKAITAWLTVLRNDWRSMCAQNCCQYFAFWFVFKMEDEKNLWIEMVIFNHWLRATWLDSRRRDLERDRKDMRASYSLRRWKQHEESLSPPQKRRIAAEVRSPNRTPSPQKARLKPVCWLPPPVGTVADTTVADTKIADVTEETTAEDKAKAGGSDDAWRYPFEARRRPSLIELQM